MQAARHEIVNCHVKYCHDYYLFPYEYARYLFSQNETNVVLNTLPVARSKAKLTAASKLLSAHISRIRYIQVLHAELVLS